MANLSDPSVSLLFKDVPLTWRSFTHLGCRAEVRDTSCFCHILADSFSLNYSFCQGAIGEDRVSSTPWIQTRFCLSVICSWTLVLFPPFGYCEKCCHEQRCIISVWVLTCLEMGLSLFLMMGNTFWQETSTASFKGGPGLASLLVSIETIPSWV